MKNRPLKGGGSCRNIFWAFIILTHPSVLQELDFIIYTRGGGSWYFRPRSRGGLANFTPPPPANLISDKSLTEIFHVVGTGQSQNIAFIGGAAAGGGLALIAIIALAVLAVKYRLARKFMNRNKVGDLYTAKDEQMSRRNAYIQEDDMIEKEDAF